MLVFKVTKKQVNESFSHVLAVPYQGACVLLKYHDRRAYLSGAYGWCADVYDFGAVGVVTGYKTTGRPVNRERMHEYNNRAYNVITDREKVNQLLTEWIDAELNEWAF